MHPKDRRDLYSRANPVREATELAYNPATHMTLLRWHDSGMEEWVDTDYLGAIHPIRDRYERSFTAHVFERWTIDLVRDIWGWLRRR